MINSQSHNVRRRGKIRREEWPIIAERFRQGETLAEIARSYQCTAPAIRYIIGRVSANSEPGSGEHDKPESVVTSTPGGHRRAGLEFISAQGRGPAGRRSVGSSTGEIWDRIGNDIASFLAEIDALSVHDTDENYEALLVATDRLLWASARTRLELQRVLRGRKTAAARSGSDPHLAMARPMEG